MMLPDIDEQSYSDYEKERMAREIEQRQQSFSLQNAIGEKIAGLQSLVGGAAGSVGGALGVSAPPAAAPSPPPEPAPEPPSEPAPPPPLPEPTPAPPPEPSQALPAEPAPAFSPEPAPLPSPAAPPPVRIAPPPSAAPPAAAPSPSSSGGLQDWITSTMGAASRAGADMQTFASNLSTSGDLVGNAFGAALKAGADPQAFMSSITAPPRPSAAPGGMSAAAGMASTSSAGAANPDASPGEVRAYIVQAAQARGIDPDIALRVANSEGGMAAARRGTFDTGSSWWPFQLHYGGKGYEQLGNVAGMGNRFTQQTGYQPGDPNAWQAATDFALDEAKKSGWGQWYGAKAQGITGFAGIDRNAPDVIGGAIRGAGEAIGGAVRGAAQQISQFGQSQLTNDEAYAACGPAAAVRFASMFGRNPSLKEALDLAKDVGWTAAGGMAGIASEKKLMDRLGIATKLVPGGQWDQFAREAQSGNPVTISTAGHYFFADGYDPSSGAFHVGRSGTDLKGGSEWMTPEQMTSRMGQVQGALFADNPQVPAPSAATTSASSLNGIGNVGEPAPSPFQVDRPLHDVSGRLTSAATGLPDTYMGTMQAASVGEPTPIQAPAQSPVDKLKSAFGDFLDSLGGMTQQPSGQPAQSQALPSDSLTNPLGRGNAQGAYDVAPREDPGLVASVDQALSSLNPPSDRPLSPGQPLRTAIESGIEAVGKQPITLPGQIPLPGNPTLGDVAGMLKPSSMMTDAEVLRSHRPDEVAQVRRTLDELNQSGPSRRWTEAHPGEVPPPAAATSDKQIADWFRDMDLSMAYAGTHVPGEGFRPPGIDPNRPGTAKTNADVIRPDRRAPRSTDVLNDLLGEIDRYPAETSDVIRNFVATTPADPGSMVAVLRNWIAENPLDTTIGSPPAVVGERAVADMESNLRGFPRAGGVAPEKGQLGLGLGEDVQPLMPETGGAFETPARTSESTGPSLDQIRIAAEQRRINAERAAQGLPPVSEMYGPTEVVPERGLTQTQFLPTTEELQAILPEGWGRGFRPEMLLPDYVPSSVLEARRIAQAQQRVAETRSTIEASRARRAARGEADVPLSDLELTQRNLLGEEEQIGMGRGTGGEFQTPTIPAETQTPKLKLPGYVPESVGNLLEEANQIVTHARPVSDVTLQKLADQTGETTERIRKAWKPSEENDAILRSASRALDQSAQELARAQEILKLDPTDVAAQADVVRALTRQQALQETVGKRRPVASSMLGDMDPAKEVTGAKAAAEQFSQIAKRAHMKSDTELAEQLAKVDMTDPDKVASLAKIARNYTFGDRALAIWYFNLLSDPLTHIRNGVGNTLAAVTSPVENLGAAALDPLARKMLGQSGPRERYFGEALANYAGMYDALKPSAGAFVDALRYGSPTKTMGELGRQAHEPFTGTPLEILGVPGRALEAEDAFFRGLNKNAALRSEAYRRAGKEGLTGDAFKEKVSKLLSAPDEEMVAAADKAAEYRVFQQDNAFASAVNNVVDKVPGGAGRLIVPFVKTPMNIMAYTLERTPIGAAGIAKDFATAEGRAGLRAKGAGDLADRMSRTAIGSTLMFGAFRYAMDGDGKGHPGITAAPPSDETERDAWERQGIQEYSILGPDGTYHSYKALQPFTGLLGTSAAMADAWKKGQLKDADLQTLALTTGMAAGQGLLDTPWTQGAADLLDMFRPGNRGDPGTTIQRMANQYARNTVPGAGLWRSAARFLDNTVRTPTEEGWGGIVQAAESGLPGLSRNVPSALNAFGQERHRPESGLWNMLNPTPGREISDDPVEIELKRLQGQQVEGLPKRLGNYQIQPGFVGKQSTVAGKLPVELTNTQERRYQELSGTTAYSLLHTLVGTEAWNALSDDDKAQKVDQIYSASRELARANMDPELAQQAYQQLVKGLGQRTERLTPPTPAPVP